MAQIANTNAFSEGDGLNTYVNIDTVNKLLQMLNGASIRFYSDAGATLTSQITGGGLATAMSATSPDPGANGQIATAGVGIALVTPAAARSGITLQAGTINGQEIWVVNQGAAANTLTLNTTPATANVADSATETAIAGLTARKYIWVGGSTNLWYPTRD